MSAAYGTGIDINANSNSSRSNADASSVALAQQRQSQRQTQGQEQTAAALSLSTGGASFATGGSTVIESGAASGGSVESGAVAISTDTDFSSNSNFAINNPKQFRNPGIVYAPGVQPTIPCATGWSAGFGVPGGGGTFGKSGKDAECERRETARVFAILGELEFAMAIMCKADVVLADAALAAGCPVMAREKVTETVEVVKLVEKPVSVPNCSDVKLTDKCFETR